MAKINQTIILEKAAFLLSRSGYDAFSMRSLAKIIPISPSVLYHYFPNQDDLLRAMFDYLNTNLGKKRAQLPQPKTASEMLKQRIVFQLENAEAIVAVLKYYLAFRHTFPQFKDGFIPEKSSLHIEEVLRFGVETGEFNSQHLEDDAKVITHAINGYLLEYFPYKVTGEIREKLVERIHSFVMRALR